MTNATYTITFEAPSEAFMLFDLRFIAVSGGKRYVGHKYTDDGRKIRIFAEQHLANPNTFTITEPLATLHQ